MAHVLVTGASGFIGRTTIAALASDGHVVRAAVRRAPKLPFGDGIEIIQHADLAQAVEWRSAVDGIDTVIHLAGVAHTGAAGDDLYERVIRSATQSLAVTAAAAGVRRFVFVSSVRAQSGPSADHALTEHDPPVPSDAYGRAKLAAEHAVRSTSLPHTILRPVPLYGAGAKGNIAALVRAAASPLPLPAAGFINRRSLLDIANFIGALRFVLAAQHTINETYLLADPGPALSLGEIVKALRRGQGRRPGIFPLPASLVEALLRISGHNALWQRIGGSLEVDTGKIAGAGWQPLHDTGTGLAHLAAATSARGRSPTGNDRARAA